jgi:hypothetical protein
MFSAGQLERAAIASLRKWFPTYLRQQERQLQLPYKTLVTPINYSNRNSFDAERGERMPKVVVISPGLDETPQRMGTRQYCATWRLGVGVAISARTEDMVNDFVKAYAASVRAIIMQKALEAPSLSISEIRWVDETYEDLPIPDQIQLYRAAGVYFSIYVDDVATATPGPPIPDQDEPGGPVICDPITGICTPAGYVYGRVEHVYIVVEKEAIDE